MIRRRPTQVFSLAFLDCICCGFGAIILVFVLSIGGQDKAKQVELAKLRTLLAIQAASLLKLSSSREDIDRTNARVQNLVVDARLRNDSLHALIDDFEKKLAAEKKGKEAMLVDIDELAAEIAARQKKPELVMKDVPPAPIGVPIGSNYIVFVIDTSGSMREGDGNGPVRQIVTRKIEDVLNSYPEVKGIQAMDSNGNFIYSSGRGGWLPDSRETRDQLKRAIRRYDFYSESTPVPGLRTALVKLFDAKNEDMHMGLYYFGDEFQDGITSTVMASLDALNPADANGNRKVTISAVGFPTQIIDGEWSISQSGEKFANLMREICYRNGGAFIALPDDR